MAELEDKINSQNKAASKAKSSEERAKKVEELKKKVTGKIDELKQKIDKAKTKIEEKKQLEELKSKASEEYEMFLKLYDPAKEGTIEVTEKDGAKMTIVHTKNGPLVEIVKEPVEIPSTVEYIHPEASQFSWNRMARGSYDKNVTYQGFFPEVNEKGVVEYKYGKANLKECGGYGDYGPHGDYSDNGSGKITGVTRGKGKLGRFEVINGSLNYDYYGKVMRSGKSYEIFTKLEKSFAESKKEAEKTAGQVAQTEQGTQPGE